MSLNVQRNSTTFSCSFRMGAIFTKNHTGVPAAEEQGHTYSIQQQHLPSLTSTLTVCTMTLKHVVWKKKKKKDSWSFCGPISWSLFWAAFELTAILLTQAVNTFAWQQRESSQLQIRRDVFFPTHCSSCTWESRTSSSRNSQTWVALSPWCPCLWARRTWSCKNKKGF